MMSTIVQDSYRAHMRTVSDAELAEHHAKTLDALAGGPTRERAERQAREAGIPNVNPATTDLVLRRMLAVILEEVQRRRLN